MWYQRELNATKKITIIKVRMKPGQKTLAT